MKVQIDIDSELWGRFRSKVINDEGKTLAEVVPGVVEPAIRAYLTAMEFVEHIIQPDELPILDRVTPLPKVPLSSFSRRCDSCDALSERLFSSNGKSVCYSCWKAAITAIPVPTPPAPPEAA